MKLSTVLSTLACLITPSFVSAITPDEYSSLGGVLDVVLHVDMIESLNNERIAPGYNGKPIGPTLRVKPGDIVSITLINNLEQNPQSDLDLFAYIMDPSSNKINATIINNRLTNQGFIYNSHYGYWGQNFMNLHFHGANFDPKEEKINVLVNGGETKTYKFQIPEDQPPVLAWYHNHNHGTSQYSMMSGLYGFIVIEGTEHDVTNAPLIDDATEVFLILAESSINPETKSVNPFIPIVMNFDWKSITNGELGENATFTFEKGEKVLFRTASASIESAKVLSIDHHMLLPVAYDGYPVRSLEASETVTIQSGSRVEFMTVFDTPGTYIMRIAPWNTGINNEELCTEVFGIPAPKCVSYDMEIIAATIIVTDNEINDVAKTDTSSLPDQIQDYHPYLIELASRPSVQTRNITLDQAFAPPIFSIPFDVSMESDGGVPVGFGMNGRLYNVNEIHGQIELDTCETWVVSSNNPTVGHTFHIHSVPFLVKEVDGIKVDSPFWRDTMPVYNNLTIHVCFPLYDGDILVHCHMPSHMDIGMGAFYKVLPKEEKNDLIKGGEDVSSTSNIYSYSFISAIAINLAVNLF